MGVAVAQPVVGAVATYEITKSYETSDRSSDGSSGSSSGSDILLEKVIDRRDGGLETEYDLHGDASAEDRARSWQFPARIFRSATGSMQLLNAEQIDARLEDWLKAAGWDRSVCGRWYFTWNAFRVECDPQTILSAIAAIDLRSIDASEGTPYSDPEAIAPVALSKMPGRPEGDRLVATMKIDPEPFRRQRAESDVALGEMIREPVTIETATTNRAKEDISGSITVTLDVDSDGSVRKRTRSTTLQIRRPDGVSENRTVTETVERRRVTR